MRWEPKRNIEVQLISNAGRTESPDIVTVDNVDEFRVNDGILEFKEEGVVVGWFRVVEVQGWWIEDADEESV